MQNERFVAMEKFSKVAVSADDTAEFIEFDCAYVPTGMIASVRAVTTGAINVTGLAVTYNGGTKKIKVAVTALGVGDVVSVIAFA